MYLISSRLANVYYTLWKSIVKFSDTIEWWMDGLVLPNTIGIKWDLVPIFRILLEINCRRFRHWV
jgi:hypothetical protein